MQTKRTIQDKFDIVKQSMQPDKMETGYFCINKNDWTFRQEYKNVQYQPQRNNRILLHSMVVQMVQNLSFYIQKYFYFQKHFSIETNFYLQRNLFILKYCYTQRHYYIQKNYYIQRYFHNRNRLFLAQFDLVHYSISP